MLQIFNLLQFRFTRDMTKIIKTIIIIEFITFFIDDERAKFINFLHLMIFHLFNFESHVMIVRRFFVININNIKQSYFNQYYDDFR